MKMNDGMSSHRYRGSPSSFMLKSRSQYRENPIFFEDFEKKQFFEVQNEMF